MRALVVQSVRPLYLRTARSSLLLRLAEIAAEPGVPIDLHMEAVRSEMPTPQRVLDLSVNNPPTLRANIDRFRTLLGAKSEGVDNLVACRVGQHRGSDRRAMR